jgi:MoxR-like ATPase
MEFLNETRVYGLKALEDYLLIPLADGNPLLLIAPPGTAKTLFIRNLTRLLGYKATDVAQFSAPTMNYEDIVGYPVPDDNFNRELFLLKGLASLMGKDINQIPGIENVSPGFKLEFADTPINVWDKRVLFIDEVNRCKYDVQNLMLQLIQDRMCAGVELKLDYIFAAQNQLSERGTSPLDNALADRFSMFIPFPKFSELALEDRTRVVSNVGYQDSPLLKKAEPVERSERLIGFLNKVRESYHNNEFGTDGFTVDVCQSLNSGGDFHIDGRRANRIATNVKLGLIIRKIKSGGSFELRDSEFLSRIVYFSMPQLATEIKGVDFNKIKTSVVASLERIIDQTKPTAKYFTIEDPIEMVLQAKRDDEINQNKELMNQIYQHALGVAERENGVKKNTSSAKEIALALHAITNKGIFDKNSIGKAIELFGTSIFLKYGHQIRSYSNEPYTSKFLRLAMGLYINKNNLDPKQLLDNKIIEGQPAKIYNQSLSNHILDSCLLDSNSQQEVFTILKKFRDEEEA